MKTKFSPEVQKSLDSFFGPNSNFTIDLEGFRAEIARLEREIERENVQPRSFEERITAEDRLRVRGMGITLN